MAGGRAVAGQGWRGGRYHWTERDGSMHILPLDLGCARHGGQRWGMGMRWFEIFGLGGGLFLEEGGRWRWGRERGRAIPLDGAGREYAYFPFVWGGLLGEGLVKIASR